MRIIPLYLSVFFFLILSILIAPINAIGQEGNSPVIDSLETLLRNKSTLDSQKVDLQNKIGYEYWIIDPNKSEQYGNQALELAKLLQYKKGEAFANRVVGVAHWARGNFDLAFKFLFDATDLYQQLNDKLGIANTILNTGMVYNDQSNYRQAENSYKEALLIFQEINEISRIATTKTKWALLLMDQKDYDKSYTLLIEALKIHEENKFNYGIGEVNNKLGDLFARKGDYATALSYFFQSVEAGKKRFDHVGISDNYQRIGELYLKKNDLGQASTYLEKSKKMAESFNLKSILKKVYFSLKELHLKKNEPLKAISYYDQYVAISDTLFNEENVNQIANLKSQHEFSQNEKELILTQQKLDLLEVENKTNNLIRLLFLMGFAMIGVLTWSIIQNKNRKLEENKVDLQNAQDKTLALEGEIQAKEKELTSYTLNFVQKNELFQNVKKAIEDIKKESPPESKKKLNTLERLIDSTVRIDEDWEDFRKHFESAHTGLISELKNRFPKLTNNDLKLIALIRINLSSKEIAAMLGISPESTKTARYRLRKKLSIDSKENLLDFILKIEKELV